MSDATIQIPISKSLKRALDKKAQNVGRVSFYKSLRAYLSDFAKKQEDAPAEYVTNLPPETIEFYREAKEDIMAGRNVSKTKNIKELLDQLHSKTKAT